ncbi:SDR family oxidoreductase [Planktomarina temperata]|nr:SDR family oxidoreductase [Planktomarina temperata]MDC1094171.1 SDR family oxidoreductase [Planktomarina temperata]
MKILVTGPFGHIGSKLIRYLSNFDTIDEIHCLDNMSTGRYPSLFNIEGKLRLKLIEQDLREYEIHDAKFDLVIHLAAMTDAAGSIKKRDLIMDHNFHCTNKALAVAKVNAAKFIFISTTSVYGKQDGIVDESCPKSQLLPQSPYAECKLREEEIVKQAIDLGYPCYILRFGTIYGISPGMRFHTAVNKFCWQAAHNIPITVWKTALHQKRPYLDVDDATRFIKHIIMSDMEPTLYNVVTENLTVFDVIEEIKVHKPHLQIEYVDSEIMNQLSYEVSSIKSRGQGFEYNGSISLGILEALKLLRSWD